MAEKGHEHEIETGQKGGAAEAHMGEAAYPVAEPISVPIGHVRWSAVLAGTVIALALTVLLSTLGAAIGLSLTRFGFGGGLGYWMVAFAAASLFLGAYMAVRAGHIRSLWTGAFYGVVVWALFLLIDTAGLHLLAGLSRFSANIAGAAPRPDMVPANVGMASAWWFFIGYLIALVASTLGGIAGTTVEEVEHHPRRGATHPA